MSDHAEHTALGRWIRGELEGGIVLTDDVLDYLDAAFGTRDPGSVLADADGGEIDSVMELVFYPDVDLQARFEGRWGGETFSQEDVAAVVSLLQAGAIEAGVTLPGTGKCLAVSVPDFVLEAFVQRLNICWHPPDNLVAAMETHCEGAAGLMTRVRLRNARLVWHDAQVSLMERFLSRMPAQSETFEADHGFLISILSELVPDDDVYGFLIDKKFFYFKSLCSAEDFERRRLSSNMEIMMMSGARSAHGSIDEWRRCMRSIDRICQALFGRTQFFQQPDSHSFDTQGGLDMQAVTRLLS